MIPIDRIARLAELYDRYNNALDPLSVGCLLLTRILCTKGQQTPEGWPVYRRTGRPPPLAFCFSAARQAGNARGKPGPAPLKNKKKGGVVGGATAINRPPLTGFEPTQSCRSSRPGVGPEGSQIIRVRGRAERSGGCRSQLRCRAQLATARQPSPRKEEPRDERSHELPPSALSMACTMSGESGLTFDSNRFSTFPSRPIRNLVKFQRMSPGNGDSLPANIT